MRILAIAALAGVCLTGGAARAADITQITYDLAGSTINVAAPIGSSGAIGGTMTIGFESAAGVPLVSGAVSFQSLLISANPFTLLVISGSLLIDLTAPITGGHLDPGNVLAGTGALGVGTLGGVLFCAVAQSTCDLFGVPPTVTLAGTVPLSIGVISFATFGTFTQLQPFAFSLGETQVSGSFGFVGSEISRTTIPMDVPEPGLGALFLVGGLVTLGAGVRLGHRAAG